MTRASTRSQIAPSVDRARRMSPPAALTTAGIAAGGRKTTQMGKWMKTKRRMASSPARARWARQSRELCRHSRERTYPQPADGACTVLHG